MDDDQYGLPDLRRLMPPGTHFPAISHPLEPFSLHRNLHLGTALPPPPSSHFGPSIHHHHVVPNINTQYNPPQGISFATGTDPSPSSAPMNSGAAMSPLCGMEPECGERLMDSGSSSSRWPRQETLTLLEIRSSLDSKFKEANHKGPLWDEVSRIMSEEHGYHRSGKKCREKFENLYKYYKKTKEGKTGRQDGKNYRFFRQLEAIYGESASSASNRLREANNNYNWQDQNKLSESLSFSISNSSHDLETSSSENNEEYHDLSAMAFAMSQSMDKEKKKLLHIDEEGQANESGRRLGWKEKVKAFIDSQMRKLMERQEAWMDNMLKTIEQREQERAWREIEWRKQETARFDREHELWAKERAWIEARDAALMEALKKFTAGNEQLISVNLSLSKAQLLPGRDQNQVESNMNESETWSLIQLRTSLDPSFQECGYSSDGLWEVIAAKMTCLGHNLSAAECKEKWENIKASFSKIADGNKKAD
ncbi:trihelix transcription factor PTL-like [Punica granatum]|uniref:Myb-like domain-containing protein n=2 Tax=Punica granatum TaxID=22663 RepID=A0A218XR17_PUNGR|nr:trihelix transcription factor PTL-like [Punica granatum]OWM87635.1 hypothetical protein CDL15_Pgr022748 [Punica granatum]PKI63705.1 hypothetical protein CRG98_015895 [Punica granatum]